VGIMKILIVDDDPIVLDSCRLILEAEGFDVSSVPSADKALETLENDDYDLLLIDVKMPEHDGMYLMQEIKIRWPEIPIVVMSGYPTPQTIADGVRMGAEKFIAKPFTPDELLEIIVEWLQRRKALKAKRALVIDDEQIVLDSVHKILKEDHYEVDVSLSSRQGLDWAIQKEYDIVLADVRMPEIGGMRVLRDIKRAKPSLPVVMITGYATVQSAVQAMKLGATDYLEKPFTPEQLLQAVASALDTAAAQPPEEQALIHKEEVIKVLERAASDSQFIANLLYHGADALEDYDLTGAEKLALLTGDVEWVEEYIGPLTSTQRRWLEQRLSAEVW